MKIENNFYFRLCYPELKGKDGSSCNYWSQSSNPATESKISGLDTSQLETNAFNIGILGFKIAVNDEFSDWDIKLNDGDRLVFIPPVTGG